MNTINTFCDSKLFLSLFLESLGLLVSPEVLLLFLGIDSPKTERADACCLCCNPFIASSCHKFTKEMNLTSYSRVRKTGSVKRKEAHKLCRCTLRGVTLWNGISPGAHLFFSLQSLWLDVRELCSWGSLSDKSWDAIVVSQITRFCSDYSRAARACGSASSTMSPMWIHILASVWFLFPLPPTVGEEWRRLQCKLLMRFW